ncbi:phosphotransferase [Cellulomonas fimi]|uniref:Aminoglycoside phosphotransferase n=1 Tax=Cellulomonas fimi (strain ATCC 484 / DSM 20113 / JCM 1341 / CCUG 24087 / LMG 16345 / NBRC 15513 / NCIMB 8980 / NCTC 7547 / NRS-133) TaxID=590998 RepID=F4H7B9_CELFA|nr:aminoglycoside phosphotransferase [Cellulomonas fimi ATCC 484]NNH06423.1 phosphotransferase [Cellulomonas fimi]VEH34451.1 Phosphotransferase enzyme family [Cellulomonas fimi]
MSADEVIALPPAFSGQRLDWRDLPRHVRSRISELAGAQVSAETSATSGFSPGFAAVLEIADGRGVFVKAVSAEQNPVSPHLARAEVRVAAALPPQVPAPRLLWSDDDGDWVLLGFEVVHGRSPELPWRPTDLDAVADAVGALADVEPLPGHDLPRTDDQLADDFTGWRHMAELDEPTREGVVARAGDLGLWARAHHEQLVLWEQEALRVCAGDALVHGDLRADNVMIDDQHRVWLIDWPHASIGAPWLDWAFMLPSVALQGGGDPVTNFRKHAVSEGVSDDDLRAVLAGLAGYFVNSSLQPPPPGIPNLRRFQAAQGVATLRWLRDLT